MDVLSTVGWSCGALVCVLLGLPVLWGVVYRAWARDCPEHVKQVRLDGRTVIVTGPTGGIGQVTAREMARRGARVIMACRNLAKAKPIAEKIRRETGNENVIVRHLELSDLSSVRKFAEAVNQEEDAIHILINNAGILDPEKRKLTPQGHELTLATNHLGPFLLTNLLLGKIKSSAPSRIVTVSSFYHIKGSINLDNLNYELGQYGRLKAYRDSKLCNVLFTKHLAKLLRGTGVTANVLHPGYVATNIFSNGTSKLELFFQNLMPRILAKTCEQGAQTTLYVALSEECGTESGNYYDNCKKSRAYFSANDPELAARLWTESARLVGLESVE